MIARARERLPGAREFIARGSAWPDSADGNPPAELPSFREFGHQQQLMDWIDRLFAALEETEIAAEVLHRDGISLAELARFRFFFEIASVEQRLRALSEMTAAGVDKIDWIVPRDQCGRLARLAAETRSASVNLHPTAHHRRGRYPIHQFARSTARRLIDRIADAAGMVRGKRSLNGRSSAPIVFCEFFANSAKVLVPIAAALKRLHGIEVEWLALRRPVQTMLQSAGIESIPLRRIAPRSHWRRGRFGEEDIGRLRAALDKAPSGVFLGTGKVPGKSYLLTEIVERLTPCFDEAIYWIETLSEAFDRLQPRCVVSTTYSNIVGRATACVAKRCGAGSVFVQHGMFPDCDFFAYFCNDLLLLWGEANRRTMLRNGIAPEQIQVVGPSIYDPLARRMATSAPNRFPRGGEPLRIAYLASRTGGLAVSSSIARRCFTAVAEAASRIPNAELRVKVHPGDKSGLLESLARDYPSASIATTGSAQDIICECDVAIVVSSTTGLEACMAGRPLIVLEVAGAPDYGPYEQYGAALQIRADGFDSAESLAQAIRSLSDPAKLAALEAGRRRLIDDLLNRGTGDATERAAQAIASFRESRLQPEPQLNAV